MKLLLGKKAFFVKTKTTKISSKIFENFSFHGIDMKPEPEPELVKSRNRNGNLKNSYGSTTLVGTVPIL
jgi:hypothetical protein